jgi:hypothetical protein
MAPHWPEHHPKERGHAMTEHQFNHGRYAGPYIDDSVNELSHLKWAAEKFKSSGFTHAISEEIRHRVASSSRPPWAEQSALSPSPQHGDEDIVPQILEEIRLIRIAIRN